MIAEAAHHAGMAPGLSLADSDAAYWAGQATLRLRREICWCWHQRRPGEDATADRLPPSDDRLQESLDLKRHAGGRIRFFREDVTAAYLTALIEQPVEQPAPGGGAENSRGRRGSWAFAARALGLDEASQFLLGLCLIARLDGTLGPVMAACANDAARPYPTLSLLQRLWDNPLAAASLSDPGHPVYRFGLLSAPDDGPAWNRPVEMAPWLAMAWGGNEAGLPFGLRELSAPEAPGPEDAAADPLLERLRSQGPERIQVLPMLGPGGSAFAARAAALGKALGRPCAALPAGSDPGRRPLLAVAAACWLLGYDLLLPETWLEGASVNGKQGWDWLGELRAVPVRLLLPAPDSSALKGLPAWAALPPLSLPSLGFEGRQRLMRELLGPHASKLEASIAEAARRFRYEEGSLRSALHGFAGRAAATPSELMAALALESAVELGHLAEEAKPRFSLEELILPPAQHRQMQEIIRSMEHLTEVHYGWGTARAWNESGLSALFCGPPGTGKTMAAEAVAAELGLPLYRIDLSQVVNKYIGETEKNLRRIFDATERTDCVLFFDEADALFGKRTEVKDAHDRFANIEISYLLERMERFKGLAILASNRRKDIDEAFLRRLRHLLEFPMPGPEERERIWRRVFPSAVDAVGLDFGFLARQFPLAGGHIRSIAFGACLLSAAEKAAADRPRVTMEAVLVAIKRELDKLSRPSGAELFGAYADPIRALPA